MVSRIGAKNSEFFSDPDPHNLVKTEIVAKYFWAWATLALKYSKGDIAYVDTFAGPGQFEGGESSTPLRVLEEALKIPKAPTRLRLYFNDSNREHIEILEERVSKLDGIDRFAHRPIYDRHVFDHDISHALDQVGDIPILTFIDPYGYQPISLDLIAQATKGSFCDTIFFFNYDAVNRAIGNPLAWPTQYVDRIFGPERAAHLRVLARGMSSKEREELVVKTFLEGVRDVGATHYIEFPVGRMGADRTAHCIVLASKNWLARSIMKTVMAGLSSDTSPRIKRLGFSYDSPEIRAAARGQTNMFEVFEDDMRMDALKKFIQSQMSGRAMEVENAVMAIDILTRYTKTSIKEAIRSLIIDGQVTAEDELGFKTKAGKIQLGDKRKIVFK